MVGGRNLLRALSKNYKGEKKVIAAVRLMETQKANDMQSEELLWDEFTCMILGKKKQVFCESGSYR